MITCGHAHFVAHRMNCYNHIITMLQQLLTASQSPVPPTHSPVKPGPPSLQSSNQNQQTPNPKQQVESLYTFYIRHMYKICPTVGHLCVCVWGGGGEGVTTATLPLYMDACKMDITEWAGNCLILYNAYAL